MTDHRETRFVAVVSHTRWRRLAARRAGKFVSQSTCSVQQLVVASPQTRGFAVEMTRRVYVPQHHAVVEPHTAGLLVLPVAWRGVHRGVAEREVDFE